MSTVQTPVQLLSSPQEVTPELGSVARVRDRFNRRQAGSERKALYVGIGLSLIWIASFAIGFKESLAVLTAAGFLLAIIGLRFPLQGLIGIGLLCSIDAITRTYLATGGMFRYNTFNYLLLIVMIYTIPLQLRQNDIHTWLFRLFLLLLIVELVWTPSMRQGILHLLNAFSFFGLYAYIYRCRRFPGMWNTMAVSIGVSAAAGGFAFFFNTEGLNFLGARAELHEKDIFDRNYVDPNALCYMFLTALFSICLALRVGKTDRRWRTMLYTLFAINAGWAVLVGSRGGILVASACAIYVLFTLPSGSRRLRLIGVFALCAFFVANAFPQLIDRSFHRVGKLFDDEYSTAERTSGRSDLAQGAWQIFLDNPAGVGTGGYKSTWARFIILSGMQSNQTGEKAAHSAWLKVLAENGIPGILLFTGFVFSYAAVGIWRQRKGVMPIGLLVTVTLSCAFLSTEFQAKGLWFIAAASIVAMHHAPIVKRRKGRKEIGRGRQRILASSARLRPAN